MTRRGAGGAARALEREAADLAAIWPEPQRPAAPWAPNLIGDRYSRRVALLKRVLPAIGLTLLLLVAVWPRLGPLLESVRLNFPAIDLREARELRMVNPRYAGTDRFNRPYVVTSAIGRQMPSHDDLMSLEQPRAEMVMRQGASVVVTAATAMYQSQAQLLDMFDDVNLLHENGTRFVTQRAHADLSSDTAEGHDPVSGHGPSGDITAEGFRILDKGDTIIFTGRSNLLLKGSKPSAKPASPAALPSEVLETAARIEAAATAPPAAAPGSPPLADVAATSARTDLKAKSPPPAKSHFAAKRDAKPASRGTRAKRDDG